MFTSPLVHTLTLIVSSFYGSVPATINAMDDSEAFVVQGEYTGQIKTDVADNQEIGLQVVAMGEGAFDAVLYHGGLPGAGWDQESRTTLQGDDKTGAVVLRTEDASRVLVRKPNEPSLWRLYNGEGQEISVLNKAQRVSPTMGDAAPSNATILFDGTDSGNLLDAKIGENGLLQVGASTKEPVRDFQMHIEFQTPFLPTQRGQGRGNSGVYIQRRYEVQILDSFGLEGVENECGALYRQKRPDVNMCLPPLAWQTYDIKFDAARFDDEGHKTKSAKITVRHNGVAVQDNYEIVAKTGAGKQEGVEPLPILFQNHSNPVQFRNMWIVARDAEQEALEQEASEQEASITTCQCSCKRGRRVRRARVSRAQVCRVKTLRSRLQQRRRCR